MLGKSTYSVAGGAGGGDVEGVRARATLSAHYMHSKNPFLHVSRFLSSACEDVFAVDGLFCGLVVLAESSSEETRSSCRTRCTGVRFRFASSGESASVAHGSLRAISCLFGDFLFGASCREVP